MHLRAIGRQFTQMNAYFLVMNSKRCRRAYKRRTTRLPKQRASYDEMRQRLKDIINENYVVTLNQINGEFWRRHPAKPLIHDRAAAQSLEGILFRAKLVRPVLVDRNRRDVLQRRQEYGNWFTNHAIIHHCVRIDECGYNIWTARNHGRARQGERA